MEVIPFLGRFHVLAVHLPIGVIVLAAGLEAASVPKRWRGRFDGVLGPILAIALATAIVAYLLGTALAEEGGHAQRALALHRNLALGTLVVCGLACGAWWLHRSRGITRWAHRAALVALLGVLSGAAHAGGSLTHGDTYLTEHAPGRFARWLGAEPPPAPRPVATPPAPTSEPLLFDAAVLPILVDRCGECHGPNLVKSGLRLDSFEAIEKGGRNGPALVAGHADGSALVTRVEKPLADDEHMPPEDRPQVTPEELALLRFWIERGAKRDVRLRDLVVPDAARGLVAEIAARAPTPRASAPPPDAAPPPPASAAMAPSSASALDPSPPAGAQRQVESDRAAAVAPSPTPAEPPAQLPPAPAAAPVGWVDVAPILASRCGPCHGPTKQKGGLRTDSLAATIQGGKGGAGVVPGNPHAGTIPERLHLASDDPMHMPPEEEPQLTADELRLLERWIGNARASAKTTPPAPSTGTTTSPSPTGAPSAAPAGASEAGAPNDPGPSDGVTPAPGPSASAAPAPSRSDGDGAAPPPVPPESSGCAACRAAPGAGPSVGALASVLALGLALAARRRRRR